MKLGKRALYLVLVVLAIFSAECKSDQAVITPQILPAVLVAETMREQDRPFCEGMANIESYSTLIKQNAADIIKETTRKETVVLRGSNLLANGVVIPAVGGAGGVMQFGDVPISKGKLRKCIIVIERSLAELNAACNNISLPPEKAAAGAPAYTALQEAAHDAQNHLALLKELSDEQRISNLKVARQALAIYDAMSEIAKQRQLLLHIIDSSATLPSLSNGAQTTRGARTTQSAQTTGSLSGADGNVSIVRHTSRSTSYKTVSTSESTEETTTENR